MLKCQLKAARALMGWTQEDFSAVSGVSVPTMRRIEAGDGELIASPGVIWKIESALKDHGVLIQPQDADSGAGVRLLWPDVTYAERRIMRARSALYAALQEIPEDQRESEITRVLGRATSAE